MAGKHTFSSQTVAAAGNVVFGLLATVEALQYPDLKKMNIHTVDLTGATNAGVATITFNSGNGYVEPQTQNAGTKKSYFAPNSSSLKVEIATEETDVIVSSQVGFSIC